MTRRAPTDRRHALGVCATAALTGFVCAALLSVAVLAPAPLPVVPFVVAVCICAPVAAAWELAGSVSLLRGARLQESQAVAELRRHLDRLPETHHPLGL